MAMSMIPGEFTILVSSDPLAGATAIADQGSRFTVVFDDEPLTIPKGSRNVNVQVEEAAVWWTIPNIIEGVNDTFYCTGPDTLDVSTDFAVTVPQGLYDLNQLNAAINEELSNLGAKVNPFPILELTEDPSTSRVRHTLNYTGVSMDFTEDDTMRVILGYNDEVVSAIGPIFPQSALAPNVAEFNQVEGFHIHSDIVDNGLRLNNNYDQIISQVNIDVPPGSQIIAKPFNPAYSGADSLTKRRKLVFWLTDTRNQPVDTAGEVWSARVVIRYLEPFDSQQI